MALLEREVIDANDIQLMIEGKELPVRVNPNVPPPAKEDVQQVLKPAPGQANVAPGERPAQA
jgi:cell division protease FtsH